MLGGIVCTVLSDKGEKVAAPFSSSGSGYSDFIIVETNEKGPAFAVIENKG